MNTRLTIRLIFSFWLAATVCYSQSDSSAPLLSQIDSLKRKITATPDDSNKVNLLNQIASLLIKNESYPGSKEYAAQALKLAIEIQFTPGEAIALRTLGDAEWSLGNAPESLSKYFASLKIEEQLSRKNNIAYLWYAIGAKYSDMGNYPEALKSFQESFKLSGELKDSNGMGKARSAMGDVYSDIKEYEPALKEYEEALAIYRAGGGKPHWLGGMAYYGIAETRQELIEKENAGTGKRLTMKDYKPVLDNYAAAVKEFELEQVYTGGAEKYSNGALASVFVKLNKLQEAAVIYNKNLEWASTTGDKNLMVQSLEGLYKIDSVRKDFAQAFLYYKEYIVYRDSLVNLEGSKKIQQEKLQYEFDKKEAIAKAENEKAEAEARRIRTIQFAAIGFFIIVAGFLYWNYKKSQKAKLKIEQAYTQLKSTQAQLIQSEKMASLGQLTAGIAHEIQNPLNFVNNFSDINKELLQELKLEAGKGNLNEIQLLADDLINNEDKINKHGKRADAIVKGMLQHSQSGRGHEEQIDINALCEEYLRLSYNSFQNKHKDVDIHLRSELDPMLPKINIVPQDIGKVLLNVLNNAFYSVIEKQKTETGNGKDNPWVVSYQPQVTIGTKKKENQVIITVTDNGNGIPENIINKIFQPFFTTKPTGQGTGLGLSLAYDIIKAHSGGIKAETKMGEGTIFTIQLPTT